MEWHFTNIRRLIIYTIMQIELHHIQVRNIAAKGAHFSITISADQKSLNFLSFQSKIDFGNFYNSFFYLFFPFFQRSKSYIYQTFHQLSFAVNIHMVFIYKFCIQGILIQPPWGPREHQLDEAHPKKFELHKISYKTKWPKGSIYSSAYLRKWQKKENYIL